MGSLLEDFFFFFCCLRKPEPSLSDCALCAFLLLLEAEKDWMPAAGLRILKKQVNADVLSFLFIYFYLSLVHVAVERKV